MTTDDFAAPLKIVLLGDSGTGKTNLLARLTGNNFSKQCTPTNVVYMTTHNLVVDNDTAKIEFWDFAGREKYRTMAKSVLNDADGILLVYDISNYTTFENMAGWLKDIIQWVEVKTVIKLVGNKSDLKHQRAVPMGKASQWAAEHGLCSVETSALDASNIKVTLEWMIQKIRATMNSVSENAAPAGIFSTCSFITSRITKEHVSEDSPSNDTQPFYIVLVDIKKAANSGAETIECVEKPLDDPDLKYVAISYRWGELQETAIDTQVGSTAIMKSFHMNTFYQLCRNMVVEADLRDIDYVWVDAICVDQTNYERRKTTIHQMSAIYERAVYILAVPDLHEAHLRQTSTYYCNTMMHSELFQHDLYYLIHGNTDQLARVEEKWLNTYGVPNDSALRQSLKRDTDYFMDGLMTYRNYHDEYNALEILDHIADQYHQVATTTTATNDIVEDHPRDWRRNGDDASLPMAHLHDCHQINCPLDLSHEKLPDWREKMIYKNGEYGNQTWKELIIERSTKLRRSMDFMADLIRDWSTRVWVISEYSIAKKKNNMKYWFTQLGVFYDMEEITFFSFDFTGTSLEATMDGIPSTYSYKSSDPAYINFHRIMINQLKQQSFLEMILKSKASKNEDRFYAIFPLTEYKSTISSKAVVSSWKIDTLVSVKLKLFEVMSTKDKLNLLFSSGNMSANLVGKALPTFASSSIDWDATTEHFTLDGEHIDHAHYNFDLISPSALTLHYHRSDHHANLSDLSYLNLRPKEFYVVDENYNPAPSEVNGYSRRTRQLWRFLQPQDPTLMMVCIPRWTGKSSKKTSAVDQLLHAIYLTGDKKNNIWVMEPVTQYHLFQMFDVNSFTRCTCDDHLPGFNIY